MCHVLGELSVVRQQKNSLKHERELTFEDGDLLTRQNNPARVSQDLRVEELWARIQECCPERHLPLLKLKRQGKSLSEIAAKTGLHESSVRRILYDLSRAFVLQEANEESACESGLAVTHA